MLVLFLIKFCLGDVTISVDESKILNEIGMTYPYVCSNFDWWPDAKVPFLRRTLVKLFFWLSSHLGL